MESKPFAPKYLARNKFGTLRVYENKPERTAEGFWYNTRGFARTLHTELFPEVTWEKGVFNITIEKL